MLWCLLRLEQSGVLGAGETIKIVNILYLRGSIVIFSIV